MNKTFNLLFYLKKAKINALGKAPIYMRITIDGETSELNTTNYITIEMELSSSKHERRFGECKSFNYYLKIFEQKAYDTYHNLIRENESVSNLILKNRLLGESGLYNRS